jgi:hypothetical protein
VKILAVYFLPTSGNLEHWAKQGISLERYSYRKKEDSANSPGWMFCYGVSGVG